MTQWNKHFRRGERARPSRRSGRATPSRERRQRLGTRPVVTPVAVRGDLLRGVVRLVDEHALGAELEVPAAGGAYVERHHAVVGVTAEGRRDRESQLAKPVE